jgi:hypothetical protein
MVASSGVIGMAFCLSSSTMIVVVAPISSTISRSPLMSPGGMVVVNMHGNARTLQRSESLPTAQGSGYQR